MPCRCRHTGKWDQCNWEELVIKLQWASKEETEKCIACRQLSCWRQAPRRAHSIHQAETQGGRKVTFACPYSKKDPMKHRDCYKYMLTRIRDVKQHLTRCHRLPMYYPRCFAIFETEVSRDGHIVDMDCIRTGSAAQPDGITEAQRRVLSQKSPANHSKEDQWFGVWDILFPGTPRPASPYIDSELLQDITLYQDFLTTSGPQILSSVLAQRGAAITWSVPNEERDLAAFQQVILEEEVHVVFNEWAGRPERNRATTIHGHLDQRGECGRRRATLFKLHKRKHERAGTARASISTATCRLREPRSAGTTRRRRVSST